MKVQFNFGRLLNKYCNLYLKVNQKFQKHHFPKQVSKEMKLFNKLLRILKTYSYLSFLTIPLALSSRYRHQGMPLTQLYSKKLK